MLPATAAGERGRRRRLALSQIASLSSSPTPRWRSGSADSARCNARPLRTYVRAPDETNGPPAGSGDEKKKKKKVEAK